MDFNDLEIKYISEIATLAKAVFYQQLPPKKSMVSPNFSSFDTLEDGKCKAFRATLRAKSSDKDYYLRFLKKEKLEEVDGKKIGDLDGDGKDEVMFEYKVYSPMLATPQYIDYCKKEMWSLVSVANSYFRYFIKFSSNNKYILIEALLHTVNASNDE